MNNTTKSPVNDDPLSGAIADLKGLHYSLCSKALNLRSAPKVSKTHIREVENLALGVLSAIEVVSRHLSVHATSFTTEATPKIAK